MGKILSAPLLLALLFTLACSESDSNPTQPDIQSTPAWTEFRDIIPLMDWDHPALAAAAQALADGDSLGAADSLLAHFRTKLFMEPPHLVYSLASADLLMEGRLILPPHPEYSLPDNPDWTEDPLGDSNWRFQYHSLRWSITLLSAWEETGDMAYLERLLFLMDDYATDCLFSSSGPEMVWYDMSASLRTEHWLEIWRRLLLADEVDSAFMIDFLHWMWIHGDQLTHFVHYHWYNNHGTFHNRAALILPMMLPEFVDSDLWFEQAYNRLETQITEMISPEGVQIEQAPAYHFSMMTLAPGIQDILVENGLSFSPVTLGRVEAMPRFACHILKPSLKLPMLSDSPLIMNLSAYHGLTDNLEFSITQGASGIQPSERFLSYPHTGYMICRSGWGQQRSFNLESHAVFDAGPLGSWHGHHDALTFTFSAWGEDLIVDSGYYTYNENEWRDYFTSPQAHNVIVAPGLDPSTRSDTPQQLQWRTGPDWAWQTAMLDLSDDFTWVRHFIYLDPGEIILLDSFAGAESESCELLLHFPPGVLLQVAQARISFTVGAAALEVFPLLSPQLVIVSGETEAIQGWYSASYNSKVPNQVAVYSNSVPEPRFMTLLHAHDGTDPLLAFEVLDDYGGGHLRLSIERASGVEILEVWTESATLNRQ